MVEGIEAGSRLFLIDEDTSATNFMVRDDFMQQVISREKEPITPFLERARDLYEKAGVSTILVAGSSGAFFYIADHIIQMDCYKPVEITERVKALCREHQAPRTQAPGFAVPGFAEAYAAGRAAGRREERAERGGSGGVMSGTWARKRKVRMTGKPGKEDRSMAEAAGAAIMPRSTAK